MKKFLKKLSGQIAMSAFNMYKDKKIQEWRGKGADTFVNSMKKASWGVWGYLSVIFLAGGGAAGTVLLTLARISYHFETACIYKQQEINSAFSKATCLLTTVGLISFLVPVVFFFLAGFFPVWKLLFVKSAEEKIRG